MAQAPGDEPVSYSDRWQPLIPLRFISRDGQRILQQAWGRFVLTDYGYHQSADHRWEDVPLCDEAAPLPPEYWSRSE